MLEFMLISIPSCYQLRNLLPLSMQVKNFFRQKVTMSDSELGRKKSLRERKTFPRSRNSRSGLESVIEPYTALRRQAG